MSSKRAAGVVFLLLVFFFTPSRPLQIAVLLYVSVPLLNDAYQAVTAAAVRLRRRDTVLRGRRGEKLDIELVLENRSRLPIFGAVFQDACGGIDSGGENRILIDLSPRERRVIRYTGVPRERGEFELGPASLRISDFFGTGERRVTAEDRCRLIVFPRIVGLPYVARKGSPQGSLPSTYVADEDTTRYRSLREYMSGDELRRVNWKAAARTGKLFTNEYERALDAPLALLLNLRLEDYALKTRYLAVEHAVECAASFASAADASGQIVALACSGNIKGKEGAVFVAPERGAAVGILDALARIEPNSESWERVFSEAIARLPYRSQAYYIGADPGDRAVDLAAAIRERGGRTRFIIAGLNRENAGRYLKLHLNATALEDIPLA